MKDKNGVFHSYEIIRIAVINTNKSISDSIIRSRVFACIGGECDKVECFDLHQFREGDKLFWRSDPTSLVVIWQSYSYDCHDCRFSGENPISTTICGNCDSEAIIASKPRWSNEKLLLLQAVNQIDNGRFEQLFNAVNDCNELDVNSSEQNVMFKKLVDLFTDYFSDRITYAELQETVNKLRHRRCT